ncbi:hypothetical protein STRIC_1989 [Streptococcus ictaluri 707-05]|uniref:Uncharacterized protein n=1 Tax=Streptococcus ictaluri 707-05 TaxID=764299 RepID=G5K595_9STRE|nr:hypothetical protein STRIC_1989 [Streptococcus ictaluri 707-05]
MFTDVLAPHTYPFYHSKICLARLFSLFPLTLFDPQVVKSSATSS